MTAYLHHPTGLETGTVYRADTASGSSTPTTVYTDRAAAQPIANGYGLTGSTLRAGGTSADPGVGFYSSVQTIYLKPVTYQGVLVGSGTVTSTGAGTDPTPSPTQNGLFEQVWATPAASTTLTGTLAAWTVTSVDCTAGAGARALPAASSVAAGVAVCAKKSDTSSNALVLSRAGSDLIFGMGSGGTSKTLNLPGETAELVSNGVDRWTVRASDTPVAQLDARYNGTYAFFTNVKAYGAKGDGTTDDTAAIAAAIAATSAGAALFFPAGRYLTGQITVSKLMAFVGAGSEITTLVAGAGVSGALLNIAPGSPVENAQVRSLSLDMANSPTANGLAFANVNHGRISDVRVKGTNGVGIDLVSGGVTVVEDCVVANSTTAMLRIAGDAGVEYTISRCHFFRDTAGTTARYISVLRTTITDVGGIYLENVLCTRTTGSVTDGIVIDCSTANTAMPVFISECVSDNVDGGYALKVKNSVDTFITASWFTGTGSTNSGAISLDGCAQVSITGSRALGGSDKPAITYASAPSKLTIVGNVLGGNYAHKMPASNPPTNLWIAGNMLTDGAALTDNYTTLATATAPGAGADVLGHTVWTLGAGGGAQTLMLRNADGGSRLRKHLRVNTAGTLEILDDAFAGAVFSVADDGTLSAKGDSRTQQHFVSTQSSSPTLVAQSGMGTSPPTPTVTGNDTRGAIGAGTGASTTIGDFLRVNYATAYSVTPAVVLQAIGFNTADLHPYISAKDVNGFTVAFKSAPAASQSANSFQLAYIVVG